MLVLGLILILVGVLVGGYTVMGGLPSQQGADVSLAFLGLNVQTSAVVVFALGALTLLLIELGVLAMRSGARKSSRRRAELQRLRRVESEVQTRQSAEVQRNATATPAASTPAPFARREPGDSDTGRNETVRTESGRNETVRSDARPDSSDPGAVRRDTSETGTSETGTSETGTTDSASGTRPDLADVRPPETGPRTTGSSVDGDLSERSTRTGTDPDRN